MGNVVAIVGRPNVGKSTLFNRLTESRDAIVDSVAGVTRDRHYGKAEWLNVEFGLIDTGGYTHNTDDIFESEIRKQVNLAIEEANIILFLVDVNSGITDFDEAIANLLRKSKKKVFVVANKVDTYDRIADIHEFYKFGLGEVYPISSSNGSQTGDLLDALIAAFPEKTPEEEIDIPKLAVVGRPNVGKSSLINVLTGKENNIVTPISGTTRDSINTRYQAFGFDFMLVDTAGIRKRSKITEDLEFYSVVRSMRSIQESDVCLLLLDASLGIEKQDLHIYSEIIKAKKGIVILVNKWDLIEKESKTMEQFKKSILERIAPFTDVPIIFTSTITKQRVHKALETAMEVYQARIQKIPTSKLNDVMLEEIERYPPPAIKGKYIRIKYCMQLPTHTPAFAFYCNLPQYVKDPYKRFLENKIRDHFNFHGVPISIFMRKK
ncbi:ribosome biogenesis GTPase Der [Luteibaculum oceani]|uniref:GTPase Der n=1 Tax=Luteibaculum oceani TaxID=1294296 RepID=A0A5C6UZK5_9FLAO|nr:ribosome biogenesis GTPase Der [Luteibaculum oceani]TXC78822.1 ribosome biogenesis GTPase Der [Luteibaculum oceani]